VYSHVSCLLLLFAVHQLPGGVYLNIHLAATLNFNGGDVNASGSYVSDI
jgi:hypothetical protein